MESTWLNYFSELRFIKFYICQHFVTKSFSYFSFIDLLLKINHKAILHLENCSYLLCCSVLFVAAEFNLFSCVFVSLTLTSSLFATFYRTVTFS